MQELDSTQFELHAPCTVRLKGEDGLCVFYNDGPGTGAAGAVPVCEKAQPHSASCTLPVLS